MCVYTCNRERENILIWVSSFCREERYAHNVNIYFIFINNYNIGQFDLLINSNSFHEIEPNVVKKYLNFFKFMPNSSLKTFLA